MHKLITQFIFVIDVYKKNNYISINPIPSSIFLWVVDVIDVSSESINNVF